MKKFWKWKNQTNPEEYLESQSLSTWYTFLENNFIYLWGVPHSPQIYERKSKDVIEIELH